MSSVYRCMYQPALLHFTSKFQFVDSQLKETLMRKIFLPNIIVHMKKACKYANNRSSYTIAVLKNYKLFETNLVPYYDRPHSHFVNHFMGVH